MCKPVYVLKNGNPESHYKEVALNHTEALTILYLFLYSSEEEIAKELEESKDTTRTRIQRLYDKCGIKCLAGKKQRTPEQLRKWALNVRLVEAEDGEMSLTMYHYVGAGRQLELEFTYD
jgi:hypothetical protein